MLLLPLALVVAVVASVSAAFRLCLPAEHESASKLRHALGDWLAKEAIDGQIAFEITLACAEAFNNAVEYPIEPALARVEIEGDLLELESELRRAYATTAVGEPTMIRLANPDMVSQ